MILQRKCLRLIARNAGCVPLYIVSYILHSHKQISSVLQVTYDEFEDDELKHLQK